MVSDGSWSFVFEKYTKYAEGASGQTDAFCFYLLIEHPAESICAGFYQADGGFGCS